jgi:Uma2 family endonuclease
MAEPTFSWPIRSAYTVDDLFDQPDDGNRYEVLGGSLVVSPPPAPRHQWVGDGLARLLHGVLPSGLYALTAAAVRMPGGDGPVPDCLVTTLSPVSAPSALPAADVHTVVEVVSPGNALNDRAYKRELYAEGGIPCYWRIELDPWKGHAGPVPLVVVRLLTESGWQTVEAAAGAVASLPLAIGRGESGTAVTMDVRLDPATLVAT